MIKYIIALFLIGSSIHIQAQKNFSNAFVPPFGFPLYLSGNFGELRSNHFHGGLDFKTQGKTGMPVSSIGEGYISRIFVSRGSGYMLHITHPNGLTSIYRHMQGFTEPVKSFTENYQYQQEQSEVEIETFSGQFPVKSGQQIGWSGNEGYSFGPHLHLDLFETESGDFVDPLPYFMKHLSDNRAPKANSILLIPQSGKGIVQGRPENKIISLSVAAQVPVEVWGEIGVGIKAVDYMDGTSNRYGVYSVTLYVDEKMVCQSTVDRFSREENRMINSWATDGFMKSFKDPGCTLRLLCPLAGRGTILIDKERDYKLAFVLKDRYGNASRYTLTLRGKRQPIPERNVEAKRLLEWNAENVIAVPGLKMNIPRGVLYENHLVDVRIKECPEGLSPFYQLHDKTVPLHRACELQITLGKLCIDDPSKYYVAKCSGTKLSYAGGKYKDGILSASVNELGTYTVAVDTIPPRINPLGKNNWGKNGEITLMVKDSETGIDTYKGFIDGKFAIFRLKILSSKVVCKIDPRRVKKGKKHTLKFFVTDKRGNTQVYNTEFYY